MNNSTIEPNRRKSLFWHHFANIAEFLSFASWGLAISFFSQMVPQFFLLYPLAFALAIAYLAANLQYDKTASLLRIAAIIFSLVGFWNLIYLYRDTIAAAVVGLAILAILGGLVAWRLTSKN